MKQWRSRCAALLIVIGATLVGYAQPASVTRADEEALKRVIPEADRFELVE